MSNVYRSLTQLFFTTCVFSAAFAYSEDITGKELYGIYCAACHGQSGEGDPRWPNVNETGDMTAPPHNERGHTWRHSTQDLVHMTLNGHRDPYNTSELLTMPAFKGILKQQEVESIVTYMRSWWQERQLDYQRGLDDSN